jgi:hypothetical protein
MKQGPVSGLGGSVSKGPSKETNMQRVLVVSREEGDGR